MCRRRQREWEREWILEKGNIGERREFVETGKKEKCWLLCQPPIADAAKGALTSQQRGGSMCGNGYPAPPPLYIRSAFVFYGPIVWGPLLVFIRASPLSYGIKERQPRGVLCSGERACSSSTDS